MRASSWSLVRVRVTVTVRVRFRVRVRVRFRVRVRVRVRANPNPNPNLGGRRPAAEHAALDGLLEGEGRVRAEQAV